MAELATLARPYANAAFDIAKSHPPASPTGNRLEQWSRMLALLAATTQTEEAQALIGSPTRTDAAKAHQLIDVVRDELDDRCRRFVQVLAEYKRLNLLPEIAAQYEALKAEAEQVLDVEIAAAAALSPAQLAAYAQALERRFEQEVNVTATVDEGLLGGAVIRAGDTVIDGSVRGRLGRLVEALQRV